MLGVPVLAGSAAYAIAETTRLRHASLMHDRRTGTNFLVLIGGSLAAGVVLDYVGLTPVQMLFWAAVLNGILAAPLVVFVVLLTSDERVMREHVNSLPLRVLGWLAALLLAATAGTLLVYASGLVG